MILSQATLAALAQDYEDKIVHHILSSHGKGLSVHLCAYCQSMESLIAALRGVRQRMDALGRPAVRARECPACLKEAWA